MNYYTKIQSLFKSQIINDNGEMISKSHRLEEYGKRFDHFLGGASRAELVKILKEPLEKIGNLHSSQNMINIKQNNAGVTAALKTAEISSS